MRGSVGKSGNPCAKFTARSGPWSSRLSRVISRMTDSVKLCALSERPGPLVSGIGTLQAQVGARAREAAHRPLQAAFPPAAHGARPPRLGEKLEHVRTAQQTNHLPAANHRDSADALADQKPGRFIDPGLLGHRDDALAHDVEGDLALLGLVV